MYFTYFEDGISSYFYGRWGVLKLLDIKEEEDDDYEEEQKVSNKNFPGWLPKRHVSGSFPPFVAKLLPMFILNGFSMLTCLIWLSQHHFRFQENFSPVAVFGFFFCTSSLSHTLHQAGFHYKEETEIRGWVSCHVIKSWERRSNLEEKNRRRKKKAAFAAYCIHCQCGGRGNFLEICEPMR